MLKTSGETVDGAGKDVCGWYEVEEECRRIEIGRHKHCCMDEVESLTSLSNKVSTKPLTLNEFGGLGMELKALG